MIFETLSYVSNDGVTVAIGDAVNYPAHDFEMQTFQANDPIKKMQYPGRWPTFSYPEYREIHVAGDILADTAAAYNAKERTLRRTLQPPYRVYTGRRHGTLNLTFFGDAVVYHAYVILNTLETPTKALYPSVGPYMITWISFDPYLLTPAGIPTLDY